MSFKAWTAVSLVKCQVRAAVRAASVVIGTVTVIGVLGATNVLAASQPAGGGVAKLPDINPLTLFYDVNVVAMTDARVTPHQDVLVQDGKILRITNNGKTVPPAGAFFIEGKGRYLMPGLAEMHAHVPGAKQKQYAQDVMLLYLAHGITTIRGMLGDAWHLELRDQLARNEVLGPRLFTAGPSINGESAPDIARAMSMVTEQAAAGYDFLKLHPGLKLEVFDAMAKTAHEKNITFQGHVSGAVGVIHAMEAGQRAIDHLDGYLDAMVDPKCLKGPANSGMFGFGIVQCVDEAKIPDMVRRTLKSGTWMSPTLGLLEQWTYPPTAEELKAKPVMRYVPSDSAAKWFKFRQATLENGKELDPKLAKRFVELRRKLLLAMYRQQVPIMLGTDAPQIFNVPGDSALGELELFARIGFTPYEALQTGTVNAAKFFNATDRFGTVREGLAADLLLVDGNPLADVKAVRKLSGVMVRGRWLSRSDLDARLAELAQRMSK